MIHRMQLSRWNIAAMMITAGSTHSSARWQAGRQAENQGGSC